MKDRPTPETDAFFRSFADGEAAPSHAEYYDRMIQLERERNELLDRLTKLEHSMPEELARLERERNNALSDLKQAEVDCLRALGERNEAREQRDRLAEALREACCAYPITWYRRAQYAIAAVEGGKP